MSIISSKHNLPPEVINLNTGFHGILSNTYFYIGNILTNISIQNNVFVLILSNQNFLLPICFHPPKEDFNLFRIRKRKLFKKNKLSASNARGTHQ